MWTLGSTPMVDTKSETCLSYCSLCKVYGIVRLIHGRSVCLRCLKELSNDG